MSNKKAKNQLSKAAQRAKQNARAAAKAEILLPEQAGFLEAEGLERTYKFTQSAISEAVDETSAHKIFSLNLNTFGPYALRYSNNGRHLLLGGRKGHIGSFDWQTGGLRCEMQLQETVRDVQFLHNETMFAVAQKRHVYLYNSRGEEINYLDKHIDPLRLEFLPYHFLLVSSSNSGLLRYHDVSVGSLVTQLKTKLGPCHVMRQNRWNAVMHCGHTNGTVTLWTPNMSTPVVKQLCHKGAVAALTVEPTGHYMATAGADCMLKIWDIRKFKDEPVFSTRLPTAPSDLDYSQRGLLGVSFGSSAQVWSTPHKTPATMPYMTHNTPGSPIHQLRFCPYEDVLGIGHAKGFASILVPGAGEPNFDSLEANPYQTGKQRSESEVKQLLDKIPHHLIALDPHAILELDKRSHEQRVQDRGGLVQEKFDPKHRKRGRSSTKNRYLRKQGQVMVERRQAIRDRLKKEKAAAAGANDAAASGTG
ncbi:uncharacterized protein MONBRDRAFT_17530 [Monosiga brevicollis MX1]|uniref:BING4 C-terminal domain-containing protein n=1 Tax=Monosiga brevicollis TaxID=81824 RepID=A9US21_MONBE|nr:uncharacterized protein MONBRDRAFT_17530 [Monosiga brevicollis MX1]EDQ92027.1 predicted protein [Monosiga brevicollis MX1]|eukprot:XP_001743313.1 hypothetical protein [Monosiga brevicollis MX1]